MGISIFYLPNYKDATHVSMDVYYKGACKNCNNESDLENFAPIWSKITSGKFPGSQMNLKKRIRDDEYSQYPIVFITSDYWPDMKDRKAHGSTCVFVVEKQSQNVANCKSYENRYIDREIGVIILEKTTIHDNAIEPNFMYWFYERDTRPLLPNEILLQEFSRDNKGYNLFIKKYSDMPGSKDPFYFEQPKVDLDEWENKYDEFRGYLFGVHIRELIKEHTSSSSPQISLHLIEWQDSWNFVIQDYFGQKMFKVPTAVANEFLATYFKEVK